MSKVSSACCSLPPVVTKDYQIKGSYSQIAGMKTYVTGPSNAKKAILMVGDIFGFSSQVLQGADILAYSDPNNTYMVLYLDFFDGSPAEASWFAPDSKDGQAKIGGFFSTTASPPAALARVPPFIAEVTAKHGIEAWGALGLCWGGKIVSLGGDFSNTVKAAAQVHPAMLDPADAHKITIPFATLASGDEKQADVEAFGENLKGEKLVETFADHTHGFMAARANLEDEHVRKGYQRGYNMMVEFFAKYI